MATAFIWLIDANPKSDGTIDMIVGVAYTGPDVSDAETANNSGIKQNLVVNIAGGSSLLQIDAAIAVALQAQIIQFGFQISSLISTISGQTTPVVNQI
jgi:hypothetical protein